MVCSELTGSPLFLLLTGLTGSRQTRDRLKELNRAVVLPTQAPVELTLVLAAYRCWLRPRPSARCRLPPFIFFLRIPRYNFYCLIILVILEMN
jgi:hypothetical protein